MTTYTPTTAHLTALGLSVANTSRTAERRTVPEAEALEDAAAIDLATAIFTFTCRGCGMVVECLQKGNHDPQKFAEIVCRLMCAGNDLACVDPTKAAVRKGVCLCSKEAKKEKRRQAIRFKRFASSPQKRRSWRLLGNTVGMERGGRGE